MNSKTSETVNRDLTKSSELYKKARDLTSENKFQEAAEVFRQSALINPHFKTLELLGECLIRLNHLSEAVIPYK